jgi:hypothetical protein
VKAKVWWHTAQEGGRDKVEIEIFEGQGGRRDFRGESEKGGGGERRRREENGETGRNEEERRRNTHCSNLKKSKLCSS